MERWHQTIQKEFLNDAPPFADLAAAQAALDRWRDEYNNERPHQSLDMATPASRFRPVPAREREALPLVVPPVLTDAVPAPAPAVAEVIEEPTTAKEHRAPSPAANATAQAVEIERMVPPSGNLKVCQQQIWLGSALAGSLVRLWIDTKTVYVTLDGRRLKLLPSRFSPADLARLRAGGARPAGPPPAAAAARGVARDVAIEVDRTVNRVGTVGVARTTLGVGQVYAGRRVTLRIERDVVHVVSDGVLVKTVTSPLTPEARARLTGARLAGAPPRIYTGPTRVSRTVSGTGSIQVAGQRFQVGLPHARAIVTVEVDDSSLRVLNEAGEVLKLVARTTTEEVVRFKAFGGWSRT